MNKPFLGIPRIIIAFVVVIVVPILGSLYVSHNDIVAHQVSLEKAVNAALTTKPTPTDMVTPTATPSPTLTPRKVFVPAAPTGVK